MALSTDTLLHDRQAHSSLHPSCPSDPLDALLWCGLCAALLAAVPIGSVSGDGIAHSARYLSGEWFWNPNHLLFDPVASWWQHALGELGFTRSGPDRLKLLSIAAGAVTLAVFRWGIASALAPNRFAANHATAWVALGAAFAGLWISDETHMLQMPFVALAAVALVRYLSRPTWGSILGMGAAAGMAALFYVSNLLLAAALGSICAAWHLRRREWRQVARVLLGVGVGCAAVAGSGFLIAWAGTAPPGAGFLDWLTAYGGGQISERVASSYGVRWTLTGVAIAAARTFYGVANAVVDVAPVVEYLRDGRGRGISVLVSVAALAAAGGLFAMSLGHSVRTRSNPASSALLLIVAAWTAAYAAFAFYWNNSDSQFYFQLAIPFGALIALLPLRRRRVRVALLVLSAFVLAWNIQDSLVHDILYPRFERVALLERTLADAQMIVYPGDDEINQLFHFVDLPKHARRVAITTLARQYESADGLQRLANEISRTVVNGGRVYVLSVYDVPPRSNPWKSLESRGYGTEAVKAALSRFPVDSRSRAVGPFTVRSIRGSASPAPTVAADVGR